MGAKCVVVKQLVGDKRIQRCAHRLQESLEVFVASLVGVDVTERHS